LVVCGREFKSDNSLPYSLVAGGDVSWISGALYPDGTGIPFPGTEEDMFVGGTFTGSADLSLRVGGQCTQLGCLDAYFDSAQDCYGGYQDAMSSQSENVDKEVDYSGLFITCRDVNASLYILDLTSTLMASYSYTSVTNCNFQAYWIINVEGSDNVTINGDSFPAVCGGVVYNILGSGRYVTITDTSVCGHVLAPYNIIYQPGGVIVGKVVAGDIAMSLQINKQNTCPNPGTTDLPTATSSPSPSGTDYLTVKKNGGIRPNDIIFIGDDLVGYPVLEVTDTNIALSFALDFDVTEGTLVYATVSNDNGRPTSSNNVQGSSSMMESSSPSSTSANDSTSLSVAVAVVLALIALAF